MTDIRTKIEALLDDAPIDYKLSSILNDDRRYIRKLQAVLRASVGLVEACRKIESDEPEVTEFYELDAKLALFAAEVERVK